MNEQNSVEQIFFRYLTQYEFAPDTLDYTVVQDHARVLQSMSDVSNSGTSIFDLCPRQFFFTRSTTAGYWDTRPPIIRLSSAVF